MHAVNGHGEKLSRKQEALISALLTESTLKAACVIVKINSATAFRWLKRPAVQEAYRQARYEVVRQAISQVQAATGKAVATLVEIMDDVDAGASARVQAAKIILDVALKGIEVEDLAARLAVLEGKGQPV